MTLARTEGAVAAAASCHYSLSGLGIDLEKHGRQFTGLGSVTLSGAERARAAHDGDCVADLQVWVRKEAILKAAGTGLATDPRTLTLDGTTVVEGPPGPWWVRDLTLADGLYGTVAAHGTLDASLDVADVTC